MSGMGLSFSELCCLFCCPPCPSKIAAKLAFLPPEPTYSFEDEDATGSKQKLVLYYIFLNQGWTAPQDDIWTQLMVFK